MTEGKMLAAPLGDWTERAACIGSEHLFDETALDANKPEPADYPQTVAAAKAVCGFCPVVLECLAHALWQREPYGVWGGMTARERGIKAPRAQWPATCPDGHSSWRVRERNGLTCRDCRECAKARKRENRAALRDVHNAWSAQPDHAAPNPSSTDSVRTPLDAA